MGRTRPGVFDNIETLRVIATLLLVTYHGIGAEPEWGLALDYPHPLRFFADILLDVRMPVFAFISGWVYAIRPNTRTGTGRFLVGKVRRLIVPGLAAALLFWLTERYVLHGGVGQEEAFVDVLTLDFVHYWYLQAIFIILVGIALLDAIAGAWVSPGLLLAIALGSFFVPRVAVPHVGFDGVLYLLPYFLMGRLFHGYQRPIQNWRGPILAVSLAAVAVAVWLNIATYLDTGTLSFDRIDLQSGLMGAGTITALMLLLPRIPVLSAFGTASFTIYLYHVFGTSGTRRLVEASGLENLWLEFGLICMGGVVLPLCLHWILSRNRITRTVFLGLRPPARQVGQEPPQGQPRA